MATNEGNLNASTRPVIVLTFAVLALAVGCAGHGPEPEPPVGCKLNDAASLACTTGNYGSPRPDYGVVCPSGVNPGAEFFAAAFGGDIPARTFCHVPIPLDCRAVDFAGYCNDFGCHSVLECNRAPTDDDFPGATCAADSVPGRFECCFPSVPGGCE